MRCTICTVLCMRSIDLQICVRTDCAAISHVLCTCTCNKRKICDVKAARDVVKARAPGRRAQIMDRMRVKTKWRHDLLKVVY